MLKKQYKNQNGFTFIELMVVLVIIVSVLISVITTQKVATDRNLIVQAVQDFEFLYAGAQDFKVGKSTYTDISINTLCAKGQVPEKFCDANPKNPWGGSFTVQANASNAAHLDIIFAGITDSKAGLNLADKLLPLSVSQISSLFSTETLTVTML